MLAVSYTMAANPVRMCHEVKRILRALDRKAMDDFFAAAKEVHKKLEVIFVLRTKKKRSAGAANIEEKKAASPSPAPSVSPQPVPSRLDEEKTAVPQVTEGQPQ
jgi:hypothetical protein